MAQEKQPLLPDAASQAVKESSPRWTKVRTLRNALQVVFLLSLLRAVLPWTDFDWESSKSRSPSKGANSRCPQVEPLFPDHKSEALISMEHFLLSKEFREQSISKLSGAVQIPSISYDDLGPIGEDTRWEIFYDFAKYLESIFPLVHHNLHLDTVNTHGLLFTWQGTDPSLKPMILMAHQDVVPVPESTIPVWTHPPFSGLYDGIHIWGRGASDCKNLLIAELTAVELLLNANWTPQRTIVISLGFDEEISGREGAGHLSQFLLDKYGKDSIAVILDEGGRVEPNIYGVPMALPATGEKGYIDVDVIVRMPGGHSSVPPAHNGIGVMSRLISEIEAHPYEPHLYDENPILALLQCGAEYGPDFPKKIKRMLPKGAERPSGPVGVEQGHSRKGHKDKLAHEVSKQSLAVKYLMTTSVAVDVVHGGVKNNALPERTVATVNHRINIGETSMVVKDKLTGLAQMIGKEYNLTVHAFPESGYAAETPRSITLVAHNTTLEPAPVTPTSLTTEHSKRTPYAVLSGTTLAAFNTNTTTIVMSPSIMTGNTDTRYYWDLSSHIFRYGPDWDPEGEGGLGNIHTVDEKQSVTGHVNLVRWMQLWIRNVDEADFD